MDGRSNHENIFTVSSLRGYVWTGLRLDIVLSKLKSYAWFGNKSRNLDFAMNTAQGVHYTAHQNRS